MRWKTYKNISDIEKNIYVTLIKQICITIELNETVNGINPNKLLKDVNSLSDQIKLSTNVVSEILIYGESKGCFKMWQNY